MENRQSRSLVLHPPFSILLTLTVLGGFLRFYQIGSEGLWIDEAFSLWMAQHPLGEMWRWVVRIDQHPPLYYALLRLWTHIWGESEASLRSLSALFGTATIPLIYLLGRRLLDERTGLLSALILAISPFHIRLAQEARMYTLLAFSASLALYALSRITISSTRPIWPRLLYISSTAAALWTHNTAIFLLIALNLIALLQQLRHASCVMRHSPFSILLWLPWIPAFVVQSVGVYRQFWLPAPTLATVIDAIGAFLCECLPLPPIGLVAASLFFITLLALGTYRIYNMEHRHSPFFILLITFATPILGELLISLRRPIFYTRTLIWASLPLYVIMAAGLRRLEVRTSSKFWPLTALIVLLILNGLSLREYYHNYEKEQWDDAAALVAEHVEPDDLILFNATWTQIPFDYYFHQLYNQPLREHGVPVDLFERGLLEPQMTESDLPRLRRLIQGHNRIWLIYSHNWYTDPQSLIPSTLEEEASPLARWDFYGLQIRLYRTENGE
jgi:mannosyltransferase